MNQTRIQFCTDREHFINVACDVLIELIQQNTKKEKIISLSGGKTPFPVYKHFARQAKQYKLHHQLFFIQTDERNSPSDSARNNSKAILESLFQHNVLPHDHFFPVSPGQNDYENSFEHCFRGIPQQLLPPRPIDVAIMGIGSDGHTASLFPDTDWQNSKSFTGYRSFRTASQPEERISLTLERLMQAEKMIFLVSGKGKEEALKKALIQKSLSIPAGYLCAKRETIWILDSEAAQALNK